MVIWAGGDLDAIRIKFPIDRVAQTQFLFTLYTACVSNNFNYALCVCALQLPYIFQLARFPLTRCPSAHLLPIPGDNSTLVSDTAPLLRSERPGVYSYGRVAGARALAYCCVYK